MTHFEYVSLNTEEENPPRYSSSKLRSDQMANATC